MIKVYYHAGCPDGFGSAWAFWKKYKQEAEYIPFRYGDRITVNEDDIVYMLDCSASREQLMEIDKQAKITVIDHHISAEKELGDLPFCQFTQGKSGAVLSWEYAFPNKEVPYLLRYIQDRDLWEWKMQHSKEICCAIDTYKKDFFTWDKLNGMLSFEKNNGEPTDGFAKLYEIGSSILTYQKRLIEKLRKNTFDLKIGVYNGIILNSPFFQSEIADYFPEYDFILTYYRKEKNKYICSLRTTKENVDVSKIAKKFGGGGHKKASGFTITNINKLFNL